LGGGPGENSRLKTDLDSKNWAAYPIEALDKISPIQILADSFTPVATVSV
jgi:hypothetical protein